MSEPGVTQPTSAFGSTALRQRLRAPKRPLSVWMERDTPEWANVIPALARTIPVASRYRPVMRMPSARRERARRLSRALN